MIISLLYSTLSKFHAKVAIIVDVFDKKTPRAYKIQGIEYIRGDIINNSNFTRNLIDDDNGSLRLTRGINYP